MEINEFRRALKIRLEASLKTTTFSELSLGGSKLRFEMAMAITSGQGSDFEPLLTVDQYHSGVYDAVIEDIFNIGLSSIALEI